MHPESRVPQPEQVAAFFQKHRTGLVTLVFTDLVDSTALLHQLGDQAGATFLRRRRQILRKVLHSLPEAEEIETAGDSFLLVFAKPSDAVRFALQSQARLRTFSLESGLKVQERMGIHLGEVVISEHETEVKAKDLYGIELATCARVMSLAAGGQVLLTRGAFDSARQVLKGEDIPGVGGLQWMSHGPYLLKGIEEPVEVCGVGEAGQGPLLAPTTSEKAQRQVRADEEPVLGRRPAGGEEAPKTQSVREGKPGEGGSGAVWAAKHPRQSSGLSEVNPPEQNLAAGPVSSSAPAAQRVDLSRMRHELRTPINHILGYCEMLMEEKQLPEPSLKDLQRIHRGGKELQTLIAHYFEEDQFYKQKDLHQLYHELRTPVNHIIGYCELLIEQAEDAQMLGPVPDLKKIRDAASNWLVLVEACLIEPAISGGADDNLSSPNLALNVGLTFKVPEPKSAHIAFKDEGTILVVDDDETSREMLARRLRRSGYVVSALASGLHALSLARRQKFDLVLLDMIMPGLDGFQVLAKFKAEAALREIPIIMLSALDEENGIARCVEMGAEDYLSKPYNPVFLRARIGACLEKKRLHDKERSTFQALQQTQRHLAQELASAADCVRSLLPEPLTGAAETEWCFQPSQALGGDAFGHHWLDGDRLAVYLLDVRGHGVGAALLSVSALNTLRNQTLTDADFGQPERVLAALNRVFAKERQNNLFFSLWYGVYHLSQRELVFASAGHPPALLLSPGPGGNATTCLSTEAPAVGCFPEAQFHSAKQSVPAGARLLVFSDGVFEIFQGADRVRAWQHFLDDLGLPEVQKLSPKQRWERALKLRGATVLEDDFSLLEVRFA